jgi:RNA polymerase sigma-70 factor (ECF subfamily)
MLSDDERLVRDALAGDPPSRRRLATRLLGTIQREVVAVLRRSAAAQLRDPRQEVQEMTQEVLVALFERSGQELRRWDPQRGRSLDSFVRLVARRRVARILSQRRGNPWANEPTDPQDLDNDEAGDGLLLRQLEQRNLLARVLDRVYGHMTPRDLELFQLLFVDERDPQEVADALLMTRGAVNAWCYRTRKLVRNIASEVGSPAPSSGGESRMKEVMAHER